MIITIDIAITAFFERNNRLFVETSVGIFPAKKRVTTALIGKSLYKETYLVSKVLGKTMKVLLDREYRGEYHGESYFSSLKELLNR